MASTTTGEHADELFAEIALLTQRNREQPDRATERRLLELRHRAGDRMKTTQAVLPPLPEPDEVGLPDGPGLPDFTPADLTPERLRAAILRDGCMVVRGLVDREAAAALAVEIDRAFVARDQIDAGGVAADGYYEPFRFEAPYRAPGRKWIKEGAGLLAVDSPAVAFELMETLDAAGVPAVMEGYLGEPVISAEKTTLRKCEPAPGGAWHQDGAFMGDVRSLNLWLSLSHCGDDAPGLDMVPRRLPGLVETGTEGTIVPNQVSRAKAEEAAGDKGIIRPIFEPGDAVFFDDLFLHATATDESMTKPRYAVETWFFTGAGFPDMYAPIALSRPTPVV